MKSVTALTFFCAFIQCAHSVITESCIDCLKAVQGGLANTCTTNGAGDSVCGEYSLTEAFYDACENIEMAVAGWDWDSCAKDDTCARWCIKLYMQANEGSCASDLPATVAELSCHHYGRLLNGGSSGCSDQGTCPYVALIKGTCYNHHIICDCPYVQHANMC